MSGDVSIRFPPFADERRVEAVFWSIFGIHLDFFSAVKCDFSLREKPLGVVFPVYANSENAISCVSTISPLILPYAKHQRRCREYAVVGALLEREGRLFFPSGHRKAR